MWITGRPEERSLYCLRQGLPDEQQRSFEQIVGNSPALKRVPQPVETVAPSDSTVLLLGQAGTGKELIARAIQDRSRRNDRTFVKVNSGKPKRLEPTLTRRIQRMKRRDLNGIRYGR